MRTDSSRRMATRPGGLSEMPPSRSMSRWSAPIDAARTEPPGVGSPAHGARAIRKLQVVVDRQYRELPEISGDVPVEFGPAIEPADLPPGSVAKDVIVLPARDVGVLVACVNPDNPALARCGMRLGPAITLDTEQLEVHFAHCAAGVPEGQW